MLRSKQDFQINDLKSNKEHEADSRKIFELTPEKEKGDFKATVA